MVAVIHEQFPAHRFRRSTGIDAPHDQLRFGWELVGPDGGVAVAGTDVGRDLRRRPVRRIAGFFGPLPARAAA